MESNTGTITGNPQWGAGKVDGGLTFDGATYVTCGNAATLNTASTSVCCWVKTTNDLNTPYNYYTILRHFGHLAALQFSDGSNNNNVPADFLTVWNTTPGTAYYTGPGNMHGYLGNTLNDGNWHHYAVTYDAAAGTVIYIDGANVFNDPTHGNLNTGTSDFRYRRIDEQPYG